MNRRNTWTSVLAALVWLVCCAGGFVALRGVTGRPGSRTRIDEDLAGRGAVAALSASRGGAWIVVNAASVSEGDPARPRWIVLCDRPGRTAMREAMVVEVEAGTGRVAGIRRPLPR